MYYTVYVQIIQTTQVAFPQPHLRALCARISKRTIDNVCSNGTTPESNTHVIWYL